VSAHTLTGCLMALLRWYRADFDKAIGAGESKVHVPPDGSIPKELQCALADGSLIWDAVILPCCRQNVSRQVVVPRIQDSSSCPICMTPDVTVDMLQEDKKLQATARAFLRCAKEKGITIQGMGVPAEASNEKSASKGEREKGGEGSGGSPHRRENGGEGAADGGGGSKAGGEDGGSGDDKAKGDGEGDAGNEGDTTKKRNRKKKRGDRGSGGGKMGDGRGPMGPGGPMGGPGGMGVMRPGGTYGRGVGSLAN